METDLNLVNLSVDLNGKDLQRCTTDVEMHKTVLYSNGSMDPNLESYVLTHTTRIYKVVPQRWKCLNCSFLMVRWHV